jgi:glycosyltransferase involved in cell wall biosynthesis
MEAKLKNLTFLSKDLICFSHLRWNFVYQRPQHLLSRFAHYMRVFYIEEPVGGASKDHYKIEQPSVNIWVITPHLQDVNEVENKHQILEKILVYVITHFDIQNYVAWYYTPMAFPFTRNLNPALTVFDCMDELSAFAFAPTELKELESELLQRSDVVFTGGNSLYESKKNKHHNIHSFPSSIDKKHFMQARKLRRQPLKTDKPTIGFFGVIDERMDLSLLEGIATLRPNWNFVIIGPVVKIDPATLPKQENIIYMGGKSYQELPKYIANWNIAMIPFALNESTKFISPTKTPEYLAAGLPVISTAIRDVVDPYGINGLAYIIDTPEEFIKAAEHQLSTNRYDEWIKDVDHFLAENSWDNTFAKMAGIIKDTQLQKLNAKAKIYV